MYNMGFFDFFRKRNETKESSRIIQNKVQGYASKSKINIKDIAYFEMEPSKAICDGITTTPIPNKSIEFAKPKRVKFTNFSMKFLKKNV